MSKRLELNFDKLNALYKGGDGERTPNCDGCNHQRYDERLGYSCSVVGGYPNSECAMYEVRKNPANWEDMINRARRNARN